MKMGPKASADIPIKSFRSTGEWLGWLQKNHSRSAGIWLKILKKTSTGKSISYAEALEGALCYGWIDGQKKSYDADAWLQKFTRRGPRSTWSKINREKARTLIEQGRMQPAGLQAIERA